ncbi:TLD domain-containing protein 2-like [Abrus precatorius]|uniref:Oxidation resistance protein 1 n=1 Tax=Abrus precatorius TaxID=3816 RepID=A0A8B8MHF6_ABRPR|nr:TLD domain-containing protein 2-like [Abrus precatorius]
MGKRQTFRSKAAHFVSDLTTVLLNPISDYNNNKPSLPPSEEGEEEVGESKGGFDVINGPDTSSFTAFLYSLLTSSECGDNVAELDGKNDDESAGVVKRTLFCRGRQSLGRAIHLATRMGGFRNKDTSSENEERGVEMKRIKKDPVPAPEAHHLPQISEPSMLISDDVRNAVYASLPTIIHGRKWLLLYSTWKHGISLSTLYRRSMIWPGLSLLVVGDRKGAVFGGMVEAPLRPSNKRKYQGTNNTFVFTNTSGCPVIYRPTGVNRYFTLCTTDFLAIGGGDHFALYLEGDLSTGSSSVSETYGNPCLAHSQEFKVKEVELWGFVYPSKYEEIVAMSRTEAPGICRW